MKKWICLLLCVCMLSCLVCALGETSYRFTVADDDLSIAEGLDENWINILLLGSDSREDALDQGRTDAMILCAVHKQSGEMRLVSMGRDMWVTIAGAGFQERINTAFHYGGPNMAMKTVNEMLGLNISRYAVVNFYGLCDMIDALGGIEVSLTRAECLTVNSTTDWGYASVRGKALPLVKSEQEVTLCGAQALAYARIRKLDNDLGRNQRQRNVIMAVIRKAAALPAQELSELVSTCLGYVSTNIGLMDMMTLGMAVLRGGLEDVEQLSLPMKGSYRFANKDGRSVLEFDHEKVRQEVHAFLYGGQTVPEEQPAVETAEEADGEGASSVDAPH